MTPSAFFSPTVIPTQVNHRRGVCGEIHLTQRDTGRMQIQRLAHLTCDRLHPGWCPQPVVKLAYNFPDDGIVVIQLSPVDRIVKRADDTRGFQWYRQVVFDQPAHTVGPAHPAFDEGVDCSLPGCSPISTSTLELIE